MSSGKLNLTRKTFLEKEELIQFQTFLTDNVTSNAILGNTKTWGLLQTDFVSDTDWKIEQGSVTGTIKLSKQNKAIDKDGLLIVQEPIDNFPIPINDGGWILACQHKYVNYEVGLVTISEDGTLSGVGTSFTSLLRGQGSLVPTKIRFIKSDGTQANNNDVYEVVNIVNDTVLSLTSTINFIAESDLKFIIIGTTPISEDITNEQLNGLYQYNSCDLFLVDYTNIDVLSEWSGYVSGKMFSLGYIFRLTTAPSSLQIGNIKPYWWTFNIIGIADKLSKTANLSDLSNKSTARSNLSVYSTTEVNSIRTVLESSISGLDADKADLSYVNQQDSTLGTSISNLDTATLKKSANLNDVGDKATSRTNLDVYSKQETKDLDNSRFRYGTVNPGDLPAGDTTINVTFSTPYTDANYHVSLSPIKGLQGLRYLSHNTKTINGFNIFVQEYTAETQNLVIDWMTTKYSI